MKVFENHHGHSHYSLMDCVTHVEKLVLKTKSKGCNSVTLTEHGTLASAYELWRDCRKHNMKPILGLEAYVVDDLRKEAAEIPYCYYHFVLMAKNAKGWANLKKLQEFAWEKGFLRKPRVDLRALDKYSEGLIATTACIGGAVGMLVMDGVRYFEQFRRGKRLKMLNRRIGKLKDIFGDDLYAEIQLNELPQQVQVNQFILEHAKKWKLPITVAQDSHYLNKMDWQIHDAMKCVSFKTQLHDEDNKTYDTTQLSIKGYHGMQAACERFHGDYITEKMLDKFCKTTVQITNQIENYEILPKGRCMPIYAKGVDPDKKMRQLCEEGFEMYISKNDSTFYKKVRKDKKLYKEYNERLDHELKVISELGFSDYFLIVWDLAKEAKKRNIPFNTRGSVAGSMVAFCLGISWIDPIRFDCTFERFLNSERVSMPDIDMDFARTKREDMIDYLRDKYGNECVAHIVNYTKWKPRGVIKDIARILGVGFGESNSITRKIDDKAKKWDDVEITEELEKFFEQYEEIPDYAQRLMGTIHGAGVHASGIVVTNGPVSKWVPVAYTADKGESKRKTVKVTEFDMYALEDLSVLKLDFLGLINLDIIRDAVELINQRKKEVPFNDIDTLYQYILNHLEDKEVFKMCRKGLTIGTFQMGGSDGMRQLVQDIKVSTIEDIIAVISLYRSALLKVGMHTEFVNRKFGGDVVYLHPRLKKILNKTYGIMLYQEDVMKTAVVLAGFTPNESDNFRKAIKLKDPKKFGVWRDKFVEGCKENNIEKRISKEIWRLMQSFADYGFCRAHAASYGLLGYVTAWLKHHYFHEYMTCVLTHYMNNDDKLQEIISEVRRFKVPLRMPEINTSTGRFTVKGKGILYPLNAIKQCGEKAIDAIVGERDEKGSFEDFEDFFGRINKRVVNVGVMTNLILAGCFRKFGTREDMYDLMTKLRGKDSVYRQVYCEECDRRFPSTIKKKEFEEEGFECPSCGENSTHVDNEKCEGKKFDQEYIMSKLFGFNVESEPLKEYADIIVKKKCKPMFYVESIPDGQQMKFAAQVLNIKPHIDKNDNEMAFVDITDGQYNASLTIFASDWERLKRIVKKGNCYIIRASKNRGNNFLYSTWGNADSSITKLVR